MNSSRKYYKNLDLIRFISCIAVLLYHLNILKGGYLAVCIFFVLTGYLSFKSSFSKEKFSILKYYSNRIKKIYLPLLIVVFLTIFATTLIPNHFWLNLKPETTSVLLGYNNFWQIGANLDYFARHANSPFIHFWYIGILLQFELFFPFIYLLLKKLKEKVNKLVPLIISIILSLGFGIYFYINSLDANIMSVYYNTFSRIFSIFFGITLGLIDCYYGFITPKKVKPSLSKFIFYLYILITIILFIFVDSNSSFFSLSMILISIISCRLIVYGTIDDNSKISIFDKIIKSLSSVSYEVYLVQYPVIYVFQDIAMNNILKIILIILIVFGISYLLKFSFNLKQKSFKFIRVTILISIILISSLGFYHYIVTKDHTKEMKELEKQLAENERIVEEKQAEYEKVFKENQDNWEKLLNDLEKGEDELEKVVSNLSVVGIGDSIMLGAVNNLYKQFPNGYFDAKTSRTAWVANGIIKNLKNRKKLGEPIIINLGANGDCSDENKVKIINSIGNRKIFWINVTNDKSVNVNKKLNNLAKKYPNLYIVDWYSISKGHPEYFVADRIHLTETGKKAYTKAIYNKIYDVYLKEYLAKKQEIINNHELESKNKLSFYGNSVLLNAFNYLKNDFSNDNFVIDAEFDYIKLKNTLTNEINENKLTKKTVFVFDDTLKLTKTNYQELIDLCNNYELYILTLSEKVYNIVNELNKENVKIINFYQEIQENNHYLMVDRVHLSNDGNSALNEYLKEYFEVK